MWRKVHIIFFFAKTNSSQCNWCLPGIGEMLQTLYHQRSFTLNWWIGFFLTLKEDKALHYNYLTISLNKCTEMVSRLCSCVLVSNHLTRRTVTRMSHFEFWLQANFIYWSLLNGEKQFSGNHPCIKISACRKHTVSTKLRGRVDFVEGGGTSIHSKYETCSISRGLESSCRFRWQKITTQV